MSRKEAYIPSEDKPTTLLLAIQAPYNRPANIDSYFDEFVNLARTNRLNTESILYIKLREIDSSYFLTKGKLQEIKEYCDEHNIDHLILSEPLSAQQSRNLTDYLKCKVFDRTDLILDIFDKSAHSAEGRLQVDIARLRHLKGRLAGRGVNMSQQAGFVGNRGPGETLKEREARHIEEALLKLKRQLDQLAQVRETQRKRRLNSQIPHACLIGYTNAGKSSILNALTKSDVLAEDKLFATLDTTTRELFVDSVKKGIISDTVGFIQKLPHQLIAAFKSTLDELQYADLLLHVVDSADSDFESHIKVVHEILDELGVHKPMVYVFNKADRIENMEKFEKTIARYQPSVVISTLTKEGMTELREFLAEWQPKNSSSKN